MSVCSLFWIQSTSLINNTFFSLCIQYSADFHILVINGARLFAYVYSTVKKTPQKCVYLTNCISALVWTSVALLVWTRFKLSNGHWHVHNEVRFWTCYILNVQVLHLSFKTIVMFKFTNFVLSFVTIGFFTSIYCWGCIVRQMLLFLESVYLEKVKSLDRHLLLSSYVNLFIVVPVLLCIQKHRWGGFLIVPYVVSNTLQLE